MMHSNSLFLSFFFIIMPKEKRTSKKLTIHRIHVPSQLCGICKVATDNNNSKPMSPALFDSVMIKRIRDLIKSNTTVDKIRDNLVNRFPDHKRKITNEMIQSHIKLQNGVVLNDTIKEPGLKIEYKHSIFIDEAAIVLKVKNSEDIKVHIMCAISSKGLRRLSINLKSRQCAQQFTRSILRKYDSKGIPFQVVMKSAIEDIAEVEKLFTRLSLHTLIFYPRNCQVSNPVNKYIHKLAGLLPKPLHINGTDDIELMFGEAEIKISTSQCQKWIERYLHYC